MRVTFYNSEERQMKKKTELTKPEKRIIGDKIRHMRRERDWSQEYCSEVLGITRTYFSKIEYGNANITLDRILDICKLFDITPAELFTNGLEAIIIQQDLKDEFQKEILQLQRLVEKL